MSSGAWLVCVFFTIGAVWCGPDNGVEGEHTLEECVTQTSSAGKTQSTGELAPSSNAVTTEQMTTTPLTTTTTTTVAPKPSVAAAASASGDSECHTPENVTASDASSIATTPSETKPPVDDLEVSTNSSEEVRELQPDTTQPGNSQALVNQEDSVPAPSEAKPPADDSEVPKKTSEEAAQSPSDQKTPVTTTSTTTAETTPTSPASSEATPISPASSAGVQHDENNCSVKYVKEGQGWYVTSCKRTCPYPGGRPYVQNETECIVRPRRSPRINKKNKEQCAVGACHRGWCRITVRYFNCSAPLEAFNDSYVPYTNDLGYQQ